MEHPNVPGGGNEPLNISKALHKLKRQNDLATCEETFAALSGESKGGGKHALPFIGVGLSMSTWSTSTC